MPALTKPEATFKEILEEMGFVVKFFEDKSPEDTANIYMQMPCQSYCLDFACPKRKIDMEVDGEYWHGSAFMSVTALQLERKIFDSKRNDELEKAGWTVFRIPASSLKQERIRPKLIQHIRSLFTTEANL